VPTSPPEVGRQREELLGLYQRWRSLSESEAEAIRAWDWPQVELLQSAKQDLQATIATAAEQLRTECVRHGLNPDQQEAPLQNVIHGLIQLELDNSRTLSAERQLADQRLEELNTANHNLQLVQRAYAPDRTSRWQSFS
jgi:hypothetical protein